MRTEDEATDDSESAWYLPDACRLSSVFGTVLGAQLLAFLLILASSDGNPWARLGLLSLYLQWIALGGASVLCMARTVLARLPLAWATTLAYGLLLAVTAIVAGLSQWLLPAMSGGDLLWRSLGIAALVYALMLRYAYVQHQWKRQIQAEARARMQALQARIRPHFLFNSMNTIASLTRTDPARAEAVVEDLAGLFRATLDERSESRLADELELVRRYLEIEQLRLGERLRIRWQLAADGHGLAMPPMILQPLVENAIHHGIEPLPEGGELVIHSQRQGHHLLLTLDNPCPNQDRTPTHRGAGLALDNVRQRLAGYYPSGASLSVARQPGHYRATLALPLDEREPA